MTARIFISHSAKGPLAEKVLRRLSDRLDPQFDVLLDRKRLTAGDRWRADVYDWLGTCQSAVVLVSPKALDSPWVQFETDILGWRAARESSFSLIPLKIGDIDSDDPRWKRFRPANLKEIQFGSIEREGDIDDAVDRVVECLAKLSGNVADQRLREWVEDVSSVLEEAGGTHRRRAVALLPKPDDDLVLEPDERPMLLAAGLVHSDLPNVARALASLTPGLRRREDRDALADLLHPVWVLPGSARDLALAVEKDPGKGANVLVDAKDVDLGSDYVRRTYCCRVETRTASFSDECGEDDRELEIALHEGFLISCGYERDELPDEDLEIDDRLVELRDLIRDEVAHQESLPGRRWFVLFGRNAVERGLPWSVRDLYGGVTFVFLGALPTGGSHTVESVGPSLAGARTNTVRRARRDIRLFTRGA